MFDIESIQALLDGGSVKYTEHFKERLEERVIKHVDVKQAILSGEIIEQCLDDEPLPSVLILGYTRDNMPLHVAVSVGDDVICLVTVYVPTLTIWGNDYKTRLEAGQL